MKFCKYEDLERLVRDYSDGMFSLIFPKVNSREKSLKCIERVFTAYIDESPRLRSSRAEEKWLIKRLRKESGFNRLANTYKGEGLSFMELDNMLTSLRVYYNNEGNKPKKRRSALWSLFVVIIIAIVVTIGVVQGIGYYEKSGGSVQEHLNSIKGEIKVQPWCDGPEFLCGFDTLYYKSGTPVEIERSRVAKNIVVMKVKGVDTVEEAQKLRNRVLYIDRDDVELDEGCYFVQDLIGLEVVDADSGESYGKITDVSQTGANDVYHITDEKGNVKLIPAIPEVVAETDIEGGVMKITPLEGLFD